MSGGRVTLGHVHGIAIRVHRSWIIIGLLVAWSFYNRYSTVGEYGVGMTIAMAAVGTVLFFGSVLVHELAHSLEAQHRDVEVRGITLFLFGGATETSFDVERPRDEFALTAVGPFSSLVLAGAFGIVAVYSTQAGLEPVGVVAGTLGWLNLGLALFNLLPGAPLDGGRILRSAVWAATKDRSRAVRVAARAGQGMGYLVAGLGLLQLFFVRGGFVGGLWLAFIGWFLAQAARSELQQHEVKEKLGDAPVGALVTDEPLPTVTPDTDLETCARELQRRPEDALAVVEDGQTWGVLLLDEVAGVPKGDRSQRMAGDVATPLSELETVGADEPIGDSLHRLGRQQPLVVTAGGGSTEVIGIITPEQLQRTVKRTMKLGSRPGEGSEPRAHIPSGGPE